MNDETQRVRERFQEVLKAKQENNCIAMLVVDDDPAWLDYMTILLRQLDCIIDTVSDGERAIEMIASAEPGRNYRVAFIDQKLPRMSGVQVIVRIKSERPDIMCVVITADPAEPALINACRGLGVVILGKPVTLQDIRAVLLPLGIKDRT